MTTQPHRDIRVGDAETDAAAFAWSPDGRRIAVLASLVRKVTLVDVDSGDSLTALDDLAGGTASIAFLPDGRVICSPRGAPGGAVSLWRGNGDAPSQVPGAGQPGQVPGNMLLRFAIDARGRLLLGTRSTPTGEGVAPRLVLYDLVAGSVLANEGPPASQLAIAPDGTRGAIVGADGQVHVIELGTGKVLKHIIANRNTVTVLAWSADSRRIATGTSPRGFGLDRQTGQRGQLEDTELLQLWDAASGERIAVARAVTSGVLSLSFSQDGRWLASASSDGTVHVLSAHNLDADVTLSREEQPIAQVLAFSPDSRTLGVLRPRERVLRLFATAPLAVPAR